MSGLQGGREFSFEGTKMESVSFWYESGEANMAENASAKKDAALGRRSKAVQTSKSRRLIHTRISSLLIKYETIRENTPTQD